MTERRYTLSEVTGALGQALAVVRANPTSSQSVERALDLYGQGVVDQLKAPPLPPTLTADENAERFGYDSSDPLGR